MSSNSKKREYVYLAQWTHCVYESDYETLSVHRNKQNAQKVIDKMEKKNKSWHIKMGLTGDTMMRYRVKKMIIKE